MLLSATSPQPSVLRESNKKQAANLARSSDPICLSESRIKVSINKVSKLHILPCWTFAEVSRPDKALFRGSPAITGVVTGRLTRFFVN
jgi:hypothetical protein